MRPRWRFLNTGAADGPSNMAVDEAILRAVRDGLQPPTVRLYSWQPPAISIGYAQDVSRDLDLERCRQRHLAVVRRLTGGRAVLHDEEATYSVIAPDNDPFIGHNTQETCRRIGRALIFGLRHLGVHAQLERATTGQGRNPSCFASTGRYEVVVEGKKLVGSAQRRLDGVILQHGSLLTGSGYKNLSLFLTNGDSASAAGALLDRVTTLSEILGRRPPFEDIASVLRLGFEEAFGCQMIGGALSGSEEALSQQLKVERYECDEWNLCRRGFQVMTMERSN